MSSRECQIISQGFPTLNIPSSQCCNITRPNSKESDPPMIECDTAGSVTGLRLNTLGLSGTLPRTIGGLVNLRLL
ncbi:hypothetical protein BC829DRAFT_17230 [Chytridium lagenaria]|nr:hypothetical protein BC829DRAFT_17230 [Chytridium lagenaria]